MPPALSEHVVPVLSAILDSCDPLLSLLFSLTCHRHFFFLEFAPINPTRKASVGGLLWEHHSGEVLFYCMWPPECPMDILWDLASPFSKSTFWPKAGTVGLGNSELLRALGPSSKTQDTTFIFLEPPFPFCIWPNTASQHRVMVHYPLAESPGA